MAGMMDPATQLDESTALLVWDESTNQVLDESTGLALDVTVLDPTELDTESASWPSTMLNLTNTVVGAGIVALPFAYASMGILLGSAMVLAVAFLASYSLRLLVRTSSSYGYISFEELGEACWGPKGRIAVQSAMLVLLVGSLIAYLVIIGEAITPIARRILNLGESPDVWYGQTWFLLACHTLVVIAPLVLIRRIDTLKYSSFVSLTSVALLVVFVIVRFFTIDPNSIEHSSSSLSSPPPPPPSSTSPALSQSRWHNLGHGVGGNRFSSFFIAVPIVCFVFTSHPNVLLLYYQLKERTPRKMGSIINASVVVSTCLYATIGIFGYLTFGHDTDGNILSNYDPRGDVFADVCRVAMVIAISLSFPLLSYPCLSCLDVLLVPSGFGLRTPKSRWYAEAICLVLGTLGLAIAVPSIVVVFSLTGASAAVCICFVLPGLFFLKLSDRSRIKSDMIAILILISFGVVFGVVATVVIVVDLIRHGID